MEGVMKAANLSWRLFCAAMIFFTTRVNAQGWQYLDGGLPHFWSISAIDTNICWAAGERMLVMKTTNGKTFIEVSNGLEPENYSAIFSRNSDSAWVCSTKQIYRTTNGGTNWNKMYEYSGPGAQYVFYDAIYFWDNNVGIAISDQIMEKPNTMFIVRTIDGGLTWNPITNGLPSDNDHYLFGTNGTFDVVGDHCWFPVKSSSDGDTTSQCYLIHSRDRGLNWESIPLPANFGSFGVSFSDTSKGLIVGYYGHIAQTTNGGKTWSMRYDGTVRPFVDFSKGTGTVWAVGPGDENHNLNIAKSTDYGTKWTTRKTYMPMALTDISVVDQNCVWISGSNYGILRTLTGGDIPSAVREDEIPNRPSSFELLQNYPNPFNPSTTIKYRVDESGSVNLTIFNELGRKVRILVDEKQSAGWHQIVWDGRNFSGQKVATGVYLYTIQNKNRTGVKKMIMLK
jgi:photosystem II stability/assembly factor-like uncharacterized protein